MSELAPIPKAHRDTTVGFGRGWYCVAEADEVPAGIMLPVTYFDRELIVYRDRDGKAHVADAYCPHLGAHLASADGCIDGGDIVCPFHKWRFDTTTGKCRSIPYSKSIPPQAKLSVYPTHETSGMILMWWDEARREPGPLPFDMQTVHTDRKWIKVKENIFESRVPNRDLPENIFDTAHIQQLHRSNGMPEITSIERRAYGLEVNFAAMAEGERVPIHHMQFAFSGLGTISQVVLGEGFGFIQTNSATPIDHERTRMHIRMYVADTGSAEMNEMIGKAFADRVMNEIGQDMKVLDFKKHLKQPLICAGDGPIMKWRQYADELFEAA